MHASCETRIVGAVLEGIKKGRKRQGCDSACAYPSVHSFIHLSVHPFRLSVYKLWNPRVSTSGDEAAAGIHGEDALAVHVLYDVGLCVYMRVCERVRSWLLAPHTTLHASMYASPHARTYIQRRDGLRRLGGGVHAGEVPQLDARVVARCVCACRGVTRTSGEAMGFVSGCECVYDVCGIGSVDWWVDAVAV